MDKIIEQNITSDVQSKKVHVDHNVLVDMEKVSKIFGKTWAVKKINLRINKGEAVALIGANGAGKSTVGRLLANAIKQTSGIIDYYFKEENIFKAIGYQSKEQQWPNGFKVRDIMELWINIYNVQDKEWIARLVDIFAIDNMKNKNLAKLSSVNLQLFAMFLACLYKPELLVIDDLSSSIDFERRNKILQLFKEYIDEGNVIVLVYPDDYFLNHLINRVVYIKNGQISEDLTIDELHKEHKSVHEFIKYVVTSEEKTQLKVKPDPFFKPIIDNLNTIVTQVENDYNEYFDEKLPENLYQFDLNVKNTIFYLIELRNELDEIATTSLSKENVDKVRLSIKKNKKALIKILKEITKVRSQDGDIKHITKIERDFIKANSFLNGKLNDVFKTDKLIINGDEMEIELEDDEKKKLKALKERYIREELKIIRLERRKSFNKESKETKKLYGKLSNEEQQVIDKTILASGDEISVNDIKVAVFDGNHIVFKLKKNIKPKDIVLFDKKISNGGEYNSSQFASDDDGTIANTIYYDNTVELSSKPKLSKEKKKFIDKVLKTKKNKGGQ